jgi:hypothetical protein
MVSATLLRVGLAAGLSTGGREHDHLASSRSG